MEEMTHNLQIGDTRTNRETGVHERWNGQFWERIDGSFANEPSRKNKTTGTKPPLEEDIPIIPPSIGQGPVILPRKPTVAFITGLVLTAMVFSLGFVVIITSWGW